AVLFGAPAHGLSVAGRGQREFVPGERPGPVQRVGPVGSAGVAVDADANQVAGDRFSAAVEQTAPLHRPVYRPVVLQPGMVLLHHEAVGVARTGAGSSERPVAPPRLPQCATGTEHAVGLPGEVLAGRVTSRLHMADVRGGEAHRGGQLLLRHRPLFAPPSQGRAKGGSSGGRRLRPVGGLLGHGPILSTPGWGCEGIAKERPAAWRQRGRRGGGAAPWVSTRTPPKRTATNRTSPFRRRTRTTRATVNGGSDRPMGDVMQRVEALIERLAAAGWLTQDRVRAALHDVPRHVFAPPVAWTGDSDRVSKEADPEGWLDLVYGDDAIITQLDDGATDLTTGAGRFTSSLSASSTVVSLLELLDVEPGHRVLDVGTGTGWTAALLSRLVGSANVTSVEVDPAVSARAAANLERAGVAPRLIVGDGAHGWALGAPYDRVHATCAVARV